MRKRHLEPGAVPEPGLDLDPADPSDPRSDTKTLVRRRKPLLRAIGRTSLALALLLTAGAAYERTAGSRDAERFPAVGKLVDVGGYRLHISCLGRGSPTVVLDAGLGGTSLDWQLIQAPLAARTRVCVYDRAGMGWSDTGPEPRSQARISEELHKLLAHAGVRPPYILVAHSLSGKSARLFAGKHPDEVAGMVLVDTRSERIDAATPDADKAAFNTSLARQARLLTVARWFGLVRVFGSWIAGQPSLSPSAASEIMLLQTQPKALTATTQEGKARSDDDEALTGKSLGSIPLVVIAAGDSIAGITGWAEAQAGLATLSTHGRLIVAEGSSHYVQIDRPEVVVNAVVSVLEAARRGD